MTKNGLLQGILLVAAQALCALLVYRTGGTQFAFAHLMYVPTLLAALRFRIPGGALFGILGGVLLGPWMPLDVASGQMQLPINWLYRMGFFILVGVIAGVLFDILERRTTMIYQVTSQFPDTGLPNRSSLEKRLTELSPDLSCSVLSISIKNYFDFGTIFGPEFGQQVIKTLADELQQLLPADAQLCQLRINTLAVLIPDKFDAQEATRLLTDLNKVYRIDGISVYINLVAGLAHRTHGSPIKIECLRQSVFALENALRKGGDLFLYDPEQEKASRNTQVLVGRIPKALKEGEFQIYYQPIISLKDDRVVSAEALIRWLDPVEGLVSPGVFLPKIQDTEAIETLTSFVVQHAVRDLGQWLELGYGFTVSFNAATRSLRSDLLLEDLRSATRANGVDPSWVTVEITEDALISDFETAVRALVRLQDLGVKIAVDDFGTGYSSLAYLSKLPIDIIKVDRSFMHGATSDRARKIFQGIGDMCHALEITVVAEGVENSETQSWLRDQGCDWAQGYYISHPLPARQFVDWLDSYSLKTFRGVPSMKQ